MLISLKIVFSAPGAGQSSTSACAPPNLCERAFTGQTRLYCTAPSPVLERATIKQPDTTPHPNADEEHLARLAVSDRSAFSALYEAHVDRVYRYLLSRTSNPADAEELTSRVFLNALSRLDQYHGRGAGFGSWLMSIAHNLLANWYRDRGRRPSLTDLDEAIDIPSSIPGPESSLEQNERIALVRRAVSALSADRQRLIALKYVDGLSNAEIGRIMGRTEGAVKALHHRTLRELQDLLAEAAEATDTAGRTGR